MHKEEAKGEEEKGEDLLKEEVEMVPIEGETRNIIILLL